MYYSLIQIYTKVEKIVLINLFNQFQMIFSSLVSFVSLSTLFLFWQKCFEVNPIYL